MSTKLEIYFIIFFILLVIVLLSLLMVIFNYKRNFNEARKSIKELAQLRDEFEELKGKHETLQSTYDTLYEQYLETDEDKNRLYNLAYVDALTGTPNRFFTAEQIDNVFATLRKDEKFALMHLDADNFKELTGIIGNSYGDELLLDISHRLNEALDENDLLSRNGSDEFLILCQNIQDTDQLDEKIRKIFKVFSYPFTVNTKEISVTVSMGVTIAPDFAKNTQMLLYNTALAMYEAKAMGKNTYYYYSDEIGRKLSNDVLIQSQLARAITGDELAAYVQPVYLKDKEDIIAYEALVRWNHHEHGLMLPEQFLKVAYSTGRIVEIDQIMLKKACIIIKKLDKKGRKNVLVSVNMSVDFLTSNDALTIIRDIIGNAHVSAGRIIIEINEGELDVTKHKEIIENLCGMGLKICVDDFGKNNASINEICSLPVYMVKVDGNIINDAVFEDSAKSMLTSITEVCNKLDIKCVVKGIEQEELRQYASSLACYGMQGFALGRPSKNF